MKNLLKTLFRPLILELIREERKRYEKECINKLIDRISKAEMVTSDPDLENKIADKILVQINDQHQVDFQSLK